jgi:hypothetical protein
MLWSSFMKTGLISLFVRWTVVLIAISSLAACGGGGGDRAVANVVDANRLAGDNAFTATLSGGQEARPTASTALGAGTLIVDPSTRRFTATIVTAGMTGTSAHILDSALGVTGTVIHTLSETAPGSGIWSMQATLSETQLNTLRGGGYSFSVRSNAFPEGEIRGPILARLSTAAESGVSGTGTTAAATTTATVFKNALTGTQVVPSAATGASAIGTAAIDHVTRTLTVAINGADVAGIEAHVHEGEPGINGPALLPLAQTSPGSGIWFARVVLTDAQLGALLAGNLYFDIHSAALRNGELRGQIIQLHRRARLNDCRFGGFGFDDCSFDGAGLFIGFGLGGVALDDFGATGFDGGDAGFNGVGSFDGGAAPANSGFGSDSPAPGFFF